MFLALRECGCPRCSLWILLPWSWAVSSLSRTDRASALAFSVALWNTVLPTPPLQSAWILGSVCSPGGMRPTPRGSSFSVLPLAGSSPGWSTLGDTSLFPVSHGCLPSLPDGQCLGNHAWLFFFFNFYCYIVALGFAGGASGKELAANAGDIEMQVRSLGGEDPWKRARLPTLVFLPEDSQGQGSLAGYSQSIELQRVRWNWSDLAHTVALRCALVSAVQQIESAVHTYIYPLLFRFPSHLVTAGRWVEFPELYSSFSFIIYLTHSNAYKSIHRVWFLIVHVLSGFIVNSSERLNLISYTLSLSSLHTSSGSHAEFIFRMWWCRK